MFRQSLISSPDEARTFEKGKIEIANFADSGVTIGRSIFEPGWIWEKCVKPLVRTNSCQAPHMSDIISGEFKVVMDYGTEIEGGPGDSHNTTGTNTWVVGDQPCVMIDFTGAKDYAKSNKGNIKKGLTDM